MKTDAIKEVLSELRRLAYAGIYDGEADDAWKDRQSDAVAELTTLEAENAAMREALRPFAEHLASIKGTFMEDVGWRFDKKVYCRLTRPLYKRDFMRAEAAITPPTGKAHDAR